MAGVQANLISILSDARKADDNPSRISWQVAVWFNYAGIYVNVGATLSAVYVIQWAAELTTEARTLAMRDPHSLPAHHRQGKILPEEYFMGHHEMQLLRQFGMPRSWEYLAQHMVWGLLAGAIFLFLALTLLLFNTEGSVIGTTLVLAILSGMFPVAYYVRERVVPAGVMPNIRRVSKGGGEEDSARSV